MKRRRAEQLQELEKVKRARLDREREREEWEEEKRLLEREREQMAFVDNEKREEEFQLKQSHLRAHIRVGEGRARPIDMLSESLTLLHDELEPDAARGVRVFEPTRLFESLTAREERELHAELCRRAQVKNKALAQPYTPPSLPHSSHLTPPLTLTTACLSPCPHAARSGPHGLLERDAPPV